MYINVCIFIFLDNEFWREMVCREKRRVEYVVNMKANVLSSDPNDAIGKEQLELEGYRIDLS